MTKTSSFANTSNGLGLLLVGVLALSGSFAILWVTGQGIGISPDSVAYIASARSLVEGHGLSIPDGIDYPRPLTAFPPLLPLVLALGGLAGVDLAAWARWLNALLFGLNGFVIGYILWRVRPLSTLAIFVGTTLFLLFDDNLEIHTWAWSEPLYILLSLLGLSSLSIYAGSHRERPLFFSALAFAMATLTRYVGVSLFMMGFMVILSSSALELKRRIRHAFIFTALYLAPVASWLMRNKLVAGSTVSRELVFHPIRPHQLEVALETVSLWLMPGRIPEAVRYPVTLTAILGLLALAALPVYREKIWQRKVELRPRAIPPLPYICIAYIALYVLTIVMYISFLDARARLHDRYLALLFGPALLALIYLWPRGRGKTAYVSRGILLALGLTLGTVYAVRWTKIVPKVRAGTHIGYASMVWREAPLLNVIRDLPEGTPIYSNGPDLVYFVTARPAAMVPHKVSNFSALPNPRYEEELLQMGDVMARRKGVLVYLDLFTYRNTYLPSEEEILQELPLVAVVREAEGTLYCLEQGGCPLASGSEH